MSGSRPPKSSEVERGTIYGADRIDVKSLPLHCKPVGGVMDLSKMNLLTYQSKNVFDEWLYQRQWLDNDSFYSSIPVRAPDDVGVARDFTDADIERMLECKTIRRMHSGEPRESASCSVATFDVPRGRVGLFKHPELAKGRARPIRHTKDVNDALPMDPEHPVNLPHKDDISGLVLDGEYMISLDAAAFFDQFPYSDEVGSRFCFRHGGEIYALTSLAMGQRQAVNVAVAAINLLVDFKRSSRRCLTYIDNVVFVGSREQVIADAREFVERCRFAGVIMNEDVSDLAALAVPAGGWCGVFLDCAAQTVCMTIKSVERTAQSWANRHIWTWRGWAAHVGLLFWSHGILEIPMYRFFPLLSFMSRVGARLTESPELWDVPAQVWPSAMEIMEEWTNIVVENRPRKVVVYSEPEWYLCTDASRWGWGYVAVQSITGEVRSHGAPWDAAFEARHGDMLGHSTFAEPHGVVNSLCHLVAPGAGVRRVRVATDNMATRWAFDKGWSPHAPQFNSALTRLHGMLPGVAIEMMFIKGESNPADKPSRGGVYTREALGAVADCLRQVMGSRE